MVQAETIFFFGIDFINILLREIKDPLTSLHIHFLDQTLHSPFVMSLHLHKINLKFFRPFANFKLSFYVTFLLIRYDGAFHNVYTKIC